MLDYFSYNFSFSNILAGPSCPYKEYDDYIRGDNMKLLDNPNKYARAKEHCHEPSPLYPSSIKAIKSLISLVIYMVLNYIVTLADIQGNIRITMSCSIDGIEPALSIPLRLLLSYVLLFKTRCFYYFVFLISESICNASGLGFRGYDERGDAQWDLVQNVDIWEVELGTNIRGVVNGWNQMTSQWLRRCAYDRVSFNPTLCTFILSAIWHGLYPGYYICFVMFSVGTVAARKVRS
jgi:lysophospholipid acyltransferase 1/2